MSPLKMRLFGAPQIIVDDQPVQFARKKTFAILAYLAVENEPVSRDKLGLLFWPDSLQSRHQVRIALSEIRSKLGDGVFKSDSDPVQLDAEVWVDVRQYHQFAHQANTLTAENFLELKALLDHARDTFMTGFTLRDCPEFDAWLQLQEQVVLRSLQRCYALVIRGLAQSGAMDQAVAYAHQLIQLDAFNEAHYRLLLELHGKMRELHQVEKVYERLCKVLAEELGVIPDQETQALYLGIKHTLQASEHPGAARFSIPTETPALGIQGMPYYGQPYFGRSKEKKKILQLLAQAQPRLISLVGMGGIGKTHLVTDLYCEMLELFPDGVLYLPLESATKTDQLLGELAGRLQMFPLTGKILPQIAAHLSQRRLLIILDNLEQLLPDASSVINSLIQHTTHLKILVTSRKRLLLHSEHVVALEGLNYPKGELPLLEIEQLQDYSAVELFLHWAQKKNAAFKLSYENAFAVQALCTQLEGLPLAIRLAAAWVEVFSPAELMAEIHRNLAFVYDDLQDAPNRHRSFRALFRSVWDEIPPELKASFTQLCLFPAGFTWNAARAITGTTPVELKLLVEQSLVATDPSSPSRYRIHQIHRYFGQQQAQPGMVQESLHKRYVLYYADFVQAQVVDLMGGDQVGAVYRMDHEYDNLQKAWSLAVEANLLVELEKMVVGMEFYLWQRAKLMDGIRLFTGALTDISFGEDALSKRLHGKLFTRFQVANKEQLLRLGNVLEMATKNEDWFEVAYLTLEIGYTLHFLGDNKLALQYFERGLRICEQHENYYYMSAALHNIADLLTQRGDLALAQAYAERCLEIRARIGDANGAAKTHILLGEISFFRLDLQAALHHTHLGQVRVARISGPETALYETHLLPWMAFFAGDFEQSARLSHQLLELSTRNNLEPNTDVLFAYQLWGLNLSLQGQVEQRDEAFQKSFALLRNENLSSMRGFIRLDAPLYLLAKFAEALSYLLLGEYERSRELAEAILAESLIVKMPLLLELLFSLDLLSLDWLGVLADSTLIALLETVPWTANVRKQHQLANQ
ncbi:MAG: hypothetical protein H6636_10395 [Anaerolineales bacterium]|nr:hypothetical protein [Anaerolineales bacterium]